MSAPLGSAATLQPRPPLALGIAQGNDLLRRGRPAEAVTLGDRLLATYPGAPAAAAFAAEACRVSGDLNAAVDRIDMALSWGRDPQHRIKKAWLLSRLLRRDEVPALAAEAADLADGNGLVLWQVGRLYYHHNLLADAVAHYERALAAAGENPSWRYDLAIARFYSGDAARAEEDLERVLAVSPQSGSVIYLRSTLGRQTAERNHVDDILGRLASGFARAEDEAGALYALAKELEDLGDYGKAFEALTAGAKKKRSTVRYDPTVFRETLREVREVQDAVAMARPVQGDAGCGAIFIVGMPRTGTTLAERMLLQSGKVKDAGELTDFGFILAQSVAQVRVEDPSLTPAQATMQLDFAKLGRQYMQAARQMAGGSELFIDKLPPNYMYCGLIHKALPKARIVHLVRDPLDTCYAIYKTLFFNAYEFSFDLRELADYYLDYVETMRHWHEVMPGAILDVRYEDLVTDTETQARRLYDWCGLEWTSDALAMPAQDAVFATASAAQVREPVHARSVHSSRRHLRGLAPLVDKLRAAGVAVP